MARPKPTKYNAIQEKFVRMEARGETRKDIMMEVFGIDVDTADRKTLNAADAKMSYWRRFPCYDEVWKDEVKRVLYGSAGKAMKILNRQLGDDNKLPWLQNKAANDLLQYGKSHIFGDDDRSVTVKIEGLPELGVPTNDG